MVRMWQFVICVWLLASSLANAQVFGTAPNLNAAIVDDGYNGTLASMTCVNIVAVGPGLVQEVKVTASIGHTWVGDLTLKVVSPANTVVTLMSIPGIVEAADNGTGLAGDSSNLASTSPIDFIDGGAKSAEQMGNSLTDPQTVCLDDGACSYDPNNGAALPGKLAAFIGQTMAGTWKFCAGDSGGGDIGAIQQVLLTFKDEIFADGFGG